MRSSNNKLSLRKQQIFELLRSGQLERAQMELRKLCNKNKRDAEAWLALGIVHGNLGRYGEAIRCFRHVIGIDPRSAPAYFNLGSALQVQKEYPEAVVCFKKVLQFNKNIPEACLNLGYIYYAMGEPADAEESFRLALQAKPDYAEAYVGLGTVFFSQGELDQAGECYRQAVAISPANTDGHYNLGLVCRAKDDLEGAVEHFNQAVRQNLNHAEAHFNLGDISLELSAPAVAEISYRNAIRARPDYVDALIGLGLAQLRQGKHGDALASCRRAIEINPESAQAYNNLGMIQQDRGELEEAFKNYRKALDIKPDLAEALHNCGNVRSAQGMQDQAAAFLHKALQLKQGFTLAHSNLLAILNYSKHDLNEVFHEHKQWAQRYGDSLTGIFTHGNKDESKHPLRVGYVSPDFYNHSVAFFLEPLLSAHCSRDFEVVCYSDVRWPDDTTARLRSLAGTWRNVCGITDGKLANLIHTDRIDILVDLAGHTEHNRLLVFARKPAPVQVSYLGYPGTTGLPGMDYRFTDGWADPAGQADSYHTEELIRLPGGFLCYRPPQEVRAVTGRPGKTAAEIVFGSFNNLAKITPEVVAVWAEILQRVPRSRILLKNKSLGDQATCQRVRSLFSEHGIDEQRLELCGFTVSKTDHLQLYNRVDIALDTFPYNGTATTCEALWMGTPVVTLAGQSHAGRVGVSLLSMAGLREFIADSAEAYVNIASRLADNPQQLAGLHGSLRNMLLESALCDGGRLAREIEAAYRSMWRAWCNL